MQPDFKEYFEKYEWNMTELEDGVWTGSFETKAALKYNLFVMRKSEWLNMAVGPLTPRPADGFSPQLLLALLRINERTQMVRFALDVEGDLALLADLPVEDLSYMTFAAALDMLIATTDTLAAPLGRMVRDPDYWPPELVELKLAE